jgi:hypothetical protein
LALQIVGQRGETTHVVELLGGQVELVPKPPFGRLVLPSSRLRRPLAWSTATSLLDWFALISEHSQNCSAFPRIGNARV